MSYEDLMPGSNRSTKEKLHLVFDGLLALFFWLLFITSVLATVEALTHVEIIGFSEQTLRANPLWKNLLFGAVSLAGGIMVSLSVWRRL